MNELLGITRIPTHFVALWQRNFFAFKVLDKPILQKWTPAVMVALPASEADGKFVASNDFTVVDVRPELK